MADKSSKMYDKSPSIKKDKDGKAKVDKPSKASMTDAGLEGNPLPGSDGTMPVDQHEAERVSMHKRHEEEQKSMHDRHVKDLKEMHKRHHEAPKADGETTPNKETK